MGKPVAGVDGAWQCPGCQNVNFASREQCNRCALPKPSFESPHPSKRGPPVAGLDGNWSCEACGNVNFQFRDTCNRCANPKPYVQPAGQKPIAGINGNWECEACGNVNFPHRDRCNRCSTPKQPAIGMAPAAMATAAPQSKGPPQAGVDGNWTCSACGNVNFAKRDRCNRCSAPKPLDVVEEYGMTPPLVTSIGFTHRGPPVAGVDGNWACPQCQNINFAHRSSCNRCGFAKPEERRGSRPVAGVNGNWACLACGNVNFPARTHCNLCGAVKPNENVEFEGMVNQVKEEYHSPAPAGKGKGKAPVVGVDGNWLCVQCENVNYGIRLSCNRCGASKPLKRKAPTAGENGNWQCLHCGNVNFPNRTECNRCGQPKPQGVEANFDAETGEWPAEKRIRATYTLQN
eukprot:symbB.v1.2.010321.t1/scaffold671.1/size323421/2